MTIAYEGVLPLLKPAGMTSHDAVAKVRRLLGMRRVGHAGTLDPQVTGVLPLCIGRATRIVEFLQELPKTYEAEMTFGFSTDTEDADGQVVEQVDEVRLTREQAEEAISRFRGRIEQVPPMYSAVKHQGKRLYELARQGIEVERKPREVFIYELDMLGFDADRRRPRIRFRARCSKGTYIRTLCADIGKALGYPAVMNRLIRTESAGIELAACFGFDQLEALKQTEGLAKALIPADQAIGHLPAVTVDATASAKAVTGQVIAWPSDLALSQDRTADENESALVRLYNENHVFLGLYRADPLERVLAPHKVFADNRTTEGERAWTSSD